MSKKLAGTIFSYNAISQDYCLSESIKSLQEVCDHVYILDAGSTDGSDELASSFKGDNITIIKCSNSEWIEQKGKEKLNYFTNKAIEASQKDGYEYQFNLQADEIIHEDSYKYIKRAVMFGYESYLVSRINLWGNPYMQLNVTEDRMPCSTKIIRLAKTNYRSIGDAESIDAQANFMFTDQIRIYHMGFVRKKDIMKKKVIHMQKEVFGMSEYDNKLDGADIFIPERWFDPNIDLIPIKEQLPLLIKDWAKERI